MKTFCFIWCPYKFFILWQTDLNASTPYTSPIWSTHKYLNLDPNVPSD
uniref:Uncharacterized protein n=1 Tax=Rhizophora mucronata TaxID=61149 RepID=A0A2P2J351_RHIMU